MAKRRKSAIPGLSFSWKRAAGITSTKRKFSRAMGIPMSKRGRQAKVGRIMTGGGCVLPILIFLSLLVSALFILL